MGYFSNDADTQIAELLNQIADNENADSEVLRSVLRLAARALSVPKNQRISEIERHYGSVFSDVEKTETGKRMKTRSE